MAGEVTRAKGLERVALQTLTETGLVVKRDHVTPPNALTEAKTATGGEFHSDGRVLVLVLKPGTSASAAN